jgi:hypothetical protein
MCVKARAGAQAQPCAHEFVESTLPDNQEGPVMRAENVIIVDIETGVFDA